MVAAEEASGRSYHDDVTGLLVAGGLRGGGAHARSHLGSPRCGWLGHLAGADGSLMCVCPGRGHHGLAKGLAKPGRALAGFAHLWTVDQMFPGFRKFRISVRFAPFMRLRPVLSAPSVIMKPTVDNSACG